MAEATTVVVPMPHMGVSVEEGTVIEWLVAVGDEVSADQVLCAIATDKVDTEVVAPADGVLARIIAEVGADVPVGEPLAELAPVGGGGVGVGSPDTLREAPSGSEATAADSSRRVASGEPTPTPQTGSSHSESRTAPGLAARAAAGRDAFGRFDPKAAAEAVLSFVAVPAGTNGSAGVLASPVAKRMAAHHGVELASLRGTGRAGRIRKVDVEQAISADRQLVRDSRTSCQPSSPPSPTQPAFPPGYADVPHEVIDTPRVRKVIAEHMARSRQTAAHMTTEVDVDLSALTEVRAEMNAQRLDAGEPKLSYLPFIARAACAALGEYPELNATFLGERTIRWQQVNLGVAVDTEEGLLVPVIKACEQLTAPEIGAAIADLAERARTRKLSPDDLAGGTFTLSNPGSVGAVSAPAIINQPQVAVLGIPTIQRRPWVITDDQGDESIEIRPILRLAVTFDHRALDGADATRFAVAVRHNLEAWRGHRYN
jgi:pyruvate/2-oxoglutarate dehydrogenase complex dihydrolipoamide acyltransferase (E2) component